MYNKMMLPIELTKILYSQWQGQISISSQDSEIYGKCLNGHGSVTFKNGNKYQGNFYNGLLSGEGKFTWANGIVYEGQFTDNRITGKGIYRWPDQSVYQGEVKDGLRHGFGKLSLEDATYEGNWNEGKKEGKGKIIFKSGSIFQGDFFNDMKHGQGKMYYYPSGNYFEGQWRNDLKDGQGTMNWIDIREKYVGQWQQNLQHGFGVHIWLQSKGEGKYLRNRYQGQWKKGVRQGYGTFFYANGAKYEGYWKDNMKEGYAFYTNENGMTSCILFEKDRMIKSERPTQVQSVDIKKLPAKKDVEPNSYALSLQIAHFYQPQTPNLQLLFNYLLRNNTQLKTWYKGISNFYDQQSQYSFCLNLEGAWKMIRGLKILGDFSLATFNRGLNQKNVNIQKLLPMVSRDQKNVNYQVVYFQTEAKNKANIQWKTNDNILRINNNQNVSSPMKTQVVHDRNKNLLFRQFVHELVWMSHSLDPNCENPKGSLQKLLGKISPHLENLSKLGKTGMAVNSSDNMSENISTSSKAEKAITPHFKKVNYQLLSHFVDSQKRNRKLYDDDLSIKLKQIIGYGISSGVFAQTELALMERIIDKYMDPEILSRSRSENWSNSSLSTKLLNIINYQLIEFEFVEIIYFLIIKKLPSHKETQQNKAKYQAFLQELKSSKDRNLANLARQKQYANEARYLKSRKSQAKKTLQQQRKVMEEQKSKRQAKAAEVKREEIQRQLMGKEDADVKDEDFEQQESELEI